MIIYNIAKTAIFDGAGKVLIVRRSKQDSRRPGEWDLPGGHIEDCEDVAAAAAREAQEEAGITLEPSKMMILYAETRLFEQDQRSASRFLLVTRLDHTPEVVLSFEHDEYRWVDLNTAITELAQTFYGEGLAYAQDHGLLS